MRKEYANWKRLAKETGLGWDNEKKTYKATNERWKKLNKVNFNIFSMFCSISPACLEKEFRFRICF